MIDIKDVEAIKVEMDRLELSLNALHVKLIKERLNEERFPGLHPKERGDVKRKSMDLTRALAELRRP